MQFLLDSFFYISGRDAYERFSMYYYTKQLVYWSLLLKIFIRHLIANFDF